MELISSVLEKNISVEERDSTKLKWWQPGKRLGKTNELHS
jgi:hypothetical protein